MNKTNIVFKDRSVVMHTHSLFACLPVIWTRTNHIHKGDKVSMEWNQEDNSIIIRKQESEAYNESEKYIDYANLKINGEDSNE